MGNLATSFFQGGADDKLAAIDAYTKAPTGTQSGTKGTGLDLGNSILNAIRSTKFSATDISGIITVKDGAHIDKAAARTKVDGLMKSSGLYKTFSDTMQQNIANAIGAATGKDGSSYLVTIGGVAKEVMAGDASDLKGIVGLLNSISGNSELASLLDMTSSFAFFNETIQKMNEWGLTDAFSELIDKIDNEELRKKLMLSNVRSLIVNGDLDNVNKVIDYFGVEQVLSRVSDAIELLITCYAFPEDTTSDKYPSIRDKFIALLGRFKTNWWLTTRNGVSVPNAAMFSSCSDDTKTLFITVDYLRSLVMVGPNYPKVAQLTLATNMYPLVTF